MKLTVIGCAGSYPAPHAPCSCYLVEAGGVRVLLDLGNGALGTLQDHADLGAIDAVVLSHLHADHCLDLCGYYVYRNYHPEGRLPRLPVWGPHGTEHRLGRAYDISGDSGMTETFTFHTVTPGVFEIGPLRFTAGHVNHPVESFAYRIEADGTSLVYSGDTAASDTLVELARDTDLLLCEASFLDGRDTYPDVHLNGREAGEHAERAGTKRLVLTHIPPWTDAERNLADARKAFTGATELARPGATYQL
ncbi:MBL fold metallo-hydrolase [Yinghuangia sp. ASG 101]|uniref:MBL fold metallo-hydrolase n=1 Tax=Yinghuangia sp. ASG 101 TaxID=2896848 RepID=UPI001E6245FA|nr:MBL fold metallo-hydrolase [Yinghuangia sp. ASG 101]UGQ09603.1 MBL fold metallo-hydrolase [Yinghuangia sp. ASG 101]